MTAPSVDVVVVNWNAGRRLRECLESLVAAEGGHLAQVTVVDNASSDGSAERVADLPLQLEVVRNPCNVGFGAACNQGAARGSSEYLLFLNPDTRLFPDTLATVVAFMRSPQASNVGICGVELVDADGCSAISCSRFPTPRVILGRMTGLNRLAPGLLPPQHHHPDELTASRVVDQVIGAFCLVRRALFVQLGGFDERYFMYFEDVDLAMRLRRLGAASYFLKDARAIHVGNVSSDQVRDLRLYYSLRSRHLFAHENWSRPQAYALLVLALTVELPLRLLKAAAEGNGSALSSTLLGYRRLLLDLARQEPRVAVRPPGR